MYNYAESRATRNTMMSAFRENVGLPGLTPSVSIQIFGEENPGPGMRKIYNPGDKIEGEVSIVAPADVRFDDICITFQGRSRTWIEKFGGPAVSTSRSTVSQTFLRLIQPEDEAMLPVPRILSKGQKYTLPFAFTVPDRLLPQACTHSTVNPLVKDGHLRLPPSLGDCSLLGDEDDQAPDMTRIWYAVHAMIYRKRESDNQTIQIAENARKVLVSPFYDDAPPMHVEDHAKDYALSKEKNLRRGLLGKKLGRISISAEEPRPLRLCPDSPCNASTTTSVSLSFIPASPNSPPPALGSLTAKLKTSTYFSTVQVGYTPIRSKLALDPQVGHYSDSTLLSSRCMGGVRWEKVTEPTLSYRSTIVVPITAPKCKYLVPSFSTCFITRAYSVELAMSVHTSGHSEPSLTLKLPLQVSQPRATARAVVNGEVRDDGEEVEEFFRPRLVGRPGGEFPQQGGDGGGGGQGMGLDPPGYSMLGSGGAPVRVRIPSPVGISPGCG